MGKIFKAIGLMFLLLVWPCYGQTSSNEFLVSEEGKQPKLTFSTDGAIHLVFGSENVVYYTRLPRGELAFSEPQAIVKLQHMHLGWRTGPQIAATGNNLLVSVVGEDNNLQLWRSSDLGQNWNGPIVVNEKKGTLPEGFHALAAGRNDMAFAAWLAKKDEGLNITGVLSRDGGKSWEKNQIIYASPGGTVCECCHPSVAIADSGTIAVMWRNALGGNRDMYFTKSIDGGVSFTAAQKLGEEQWKLEGCPVDGGDIAFDAGGDVLAVWRRQNSLYLTTSDHTEMPLGEGRQGVVLASMNGPFLAWQKNQQILTVSPASKQPRTIGKGSFAVLAASQDRTMIALAYQAESGIQMQLFGVK